MDIAIHNRSGKKEGTLKVSDRLFSAKLNRDLVVQIATSQMSNIRQVLAHTKTRAEVRGGGKKPWNQKGTGRARHGSIRSPLWVGGGVSHGPTKDVNFKKKIGKAQGRAALAAVLSSRVSEGRFLVVDSLSVTSGKTKDALTTLTGITKGFDGYRSGERILLVLPGTQEDMGVRRATGNIGHVQTMRAQDLNVLTVLSFPYVIAEASAIPVIEKIFTVSK